MAGDVQSKNPWQADDSQFPRAGSPIDKLVFCLNYAILAPSIHNTQPWLFRPMDDAVEIYTDRSRMLPATDPAGREMTISCGAALTNLLVAVRRFGYEGWVQYCPDRGNADFLASVRLGRPRAPGHQEESLFQSIQRRRSVRTPFQDRPVPRELQRRLIWLASEFGCWIYFAESDRDRDAVAFLVESAQRSRLDDEPYQNERLTWLGNGYPAGAPSDFDSGASAALAHSRSGMPERTPGLRWLERDQSLIQASPALLVLGTRGDTPYEWLRAGEALQQILLRAGIEHVSASFLNQPCQLPWLREDLRAITGRNGPPQALLRMGYSAGTAPSPRRPVEEVILHSG
jgi:hypothetical protein